MKVVLRDEDGRRQRRRKCVFHAGRPKSRDVAVVAASLSHARLPEEPVARCRRAHAASLRMRRKRKVVRDRERRKEGRARGLASNPAAMSLLHDASTAWYGVHASLRYSTRSTASGGGALGGAIGGWEGHARPMEVKPSSFFCERSKRPRLTGQPRHRLQAVGCLSISE